MQHLRMDSKDARSQNITSMFLLLVACMSSFFISNPFLLSLVVKTIVAPRCAKPFAVSFPMPDVAPVMNMILSFKYTHPL